MKITTANKCICKNRAGQSMNSLPSQILERLAVIYKHVTGRTSPVCLAGRIRISPAIEILIFTVLRTY
jgi:hypothetical protein